MRIEAYFRMTPETGSVPEVVVPMTTERRTRTPVVVDAHRFVVVVDATCEEMTGWDTHHEPKFSSRPSAAEPLND